MGSREKTFNIFIEVQVENKDENVPLFQNSGKKKWIKLL